jgi:phosphonate transport system substrate-binding protein
MSDEVILAVNVDTAYHDVADLSSGIRVAVTEDPAVHMIGMIMLEAGDLGPHNTETLLCDTYVLVAKQLIQNKADVGVFLAKAYDDLSKIIKNQLRILVKSQISVVNHALMVGPKLMDKRSDLQALLMDMAHNEKGADVLKNLGIKGFVAVDHEEMEFMIDLMDTLAI